MNIVLIKKLVNFKDKKTGKERQFYNFFLRLENGVMLKVLPNTWTDEKKVQHSNYKELVIVASDELPFDK